MTIEKPSSDLVPATNTGDFSQGSKNIGTPTPRHLVLGRLCEKFVLQKLLDCGWRLRGHDVRLWGVQVDLLVSDRHHRWLVVEVKAVAEASWLEGRLKDRQRRRLQRVVRGLAEGWWNNELEVGIEPKQVELWLAVVLPLGPNRQSRVQFFRDGG